MTDVPTDASRDGTGEERATVPVAPMDVAPELFPSDVAGDDETGRGDR